MGTVHKLPERSDLPANIEAEQALLGAVLVNNDSHNHVAAFLRPEHFSEGIHARIYEAIVALRAAGRIVTPITLKNYFEQDETLAQIGGPTYLGRLASAATTIINVPEYGRVILDCAQRRSLIRLCLDTAESAAAPAVDSTVRKELAEHIGQAQSIFDDSPSGRRTSMSIGEAGKEALARLQRLQAGEIDVSAIATGVPALDRLTGGFRRGQYIVLGARPSVGKSTLAVQLALNVAEQGHGVAFFSLEMPMVDLLPRFISSRLWTPGVPMPSYQEILRGSSIRNEEMDAISSVTAEMRTLPIVIDDEPGLTAVEIEARARVIAGKLQARGQKLGLVVVDHIHKCRAPGAQSRVAEYSEISGGLAEAAKRLDAPLLCLAQLNRSLEGRDEKRPTLADLRESGAIEQDADVVMFLYRQSYYLARTRGKTSMDDIRRLEELDAVSNELELIVAKQRSGPVDTVRLFVDIGANVIRDRLEAVA